jgi:hypothetical protein
MKQVFMVIGEIRDWLNAGVAEVSSETTPESRLYSTTTLIAMGIIAAFQSGIPATLKNLMRITGFSSMQIYRGTTTLTKRGFLERNDDGVWFWKVEVPKDILNIHPVPAVNDSSNDELKAFITETLSNIQLTTPNGKEKLEEVVAQVKQFKTTKPKPRPATGPKALFGDAVLDIDGDDGTNGTNPTS